METAIGDVCGYEIQEGKKVPCEGKLYYRGYEIQDIIKDCVTDKRYGFEEVVYLLLFGDLPTEGELSQFRELLAKWSRLPANFAFSGFQHYDKVGELYYCASFL